MSIITLTTDFGLSDWYVGTMKGVILSLQPRTRIVDITHEIPSGDVRAGAIVLAASYRFFPRATVHVAVVDPGVGSDRAPLAVETKNYFFVGPDNGILSLALARESIKSIRRLENPKFFLPTVSSTFHGRDVFAPVAAYLSRGAPLTPLGPKINQFVKLAWPQPTRDHNFIRGEIVYIDHFGNAITNIDSATLFTRQQLAGAAFVRRKRLCSIQPFYQAVPVNQPLSVIGSAGFLEIAVNGGSAARMFGLKVGDKVTVRLA